jgi:hypothetical protein
LPLCQTGIIYYATGLQKLNIQNELAMQTETKPEDSNFLTIDNLDANSDSKIEFENVTNSGVGDVKGSKYLDD